MRRAGMARVLVAVIGADAGLLLAAVAVTAPYLPLIDPNKPMAPFADDRGPPRTASLFWLGADSRGRDMLSRTIWGCQRVLVWGVTATLVAYVVGSVLRSDRRLSRRLVGPGDLVRLQHLAVVSGDGAVHPDPQLSRAERLQHRHRRHLRRRRRPSCGSCAA